MTQLEMLPCPGLHWFTSHNDAGISCSTKESRTGRPDAVQLYHFQPPLYTKNGGTARMIHKPLLLVHYGGLHLLQLVQADFLFVWSNLKYARTGIQRPSLLQPRPQGATEPSTAQSFGCFEVATLWFGAWTVGIGFVPKNGWDSQILFWSLGFWGTVFSDKVM